jgi:hypothetical protein
MPRKPNLAATELPPGYKAPPRPVRQLNPLRSRLKRFLEVRWSNNGIPVKISEIQLALEIPSKSWPEHKREVERWLTVAGWRNCSRKINSSQPARTGWWPPLKPVKRIDDWSEYDD